MTLRLVVLARLAVATGVIVIVVTSLTLASSFDSVSHALQQEGRAHDPSLRSLTETVSGTPTIAFTSDGRPIVTYADRGPDGADDPRIRVLICADTACSDPPESDTKMPATSGRAFGEVIDGQAFVAFESSAGPALVSCDAATCSQGASLVNLGAITNPAASVVGLDVGAEGRLHLLLTGRPGGIPTSWLVTCAGTNCPSSSVTELTGQAHGFKLKAGSRSFVLTQDDGSITYVGCADLGCQDVSTTQTGLTGSSAIMARGIGGISGNPIVAFIDLAGAVRIAHCSDFRCRGDAQANSIVLQPTPGIEVTRLIDLATMGIGAPVVVVEEVDALGAVQLRQVVVSPCIEFECAGPGSIEVVGLAPTDAATIDMALSPDGTLHVVSAGDMAVMHASCVHACQCAASVCVQQSILDTCIGGGSDVAFELELAAAVGDIEVVDLALGHSPTEGPDVILGTFSDDEIIGGAGDVVCAGDGDDTVSFEPPPDDLGEGVMYAGKAFGGRGDDFIDLSALDQGSARGSVGNDTIVGSSGDDSLFGEWGDDKIWGGPGDDFIEGNTGDDRLRGGPGDDLIRGGSHLNTADGTDDINGSSGNDIIYGSDGADTLRGGTGDDQIYGGQGDDALVAGNGGADLVVGGPGDDLLLTGGPRPDQVEGGEGDDVLKGNKGADILVGGAGNDEIRGGPQPDELFGGSGTDDCYGGTQIDAFTSCESVIE